MRCVRWMPAKNNPFCKVQSGEFKVHGHWLDAEHAKPFSVHCGPQFKQKCPSTLMVTKSQKIEKRLYPGKYTEQYCPTPGTCGVPLRLPCRVVVLAGVVLGIVEVVVGNWDVVVMVVDWMVVVIVVGWIVVVMVDD